MEATSGWNAAIRIQGRDNRIAEQSKELIALQAENARLREALFSIEQSGHPDAPSIGTEYEWAMSLVETARAALGSR